jgi:hypothetical protein
VAKELDKEGREAQWKDGWHTDAEGIDHQLKNMDYGHLRRTIKSFRGHNARPLEKALRVKEREMISIVIDYLQFRQDREEKKEGRKAKRRASAAKTARRALEIY